jgi:hypothetical protein
MASGRIPLSFSLQKWELSFFVEFEISEFLRGAIILIRETFH